MTALGRAAGIHRISLSTPFAIGPVNCWLIDDDPLTLFDAGPNAEGAIEELERGLAAHGRAVEDLGRIVVSHQHLDHFGLAGQLAERSGAEVCALGELAPWLADFERAMAHDDAWVEAIMTPHGVPADVRRAQCAINASFRAWGASATVTRPLRDGEALRFAGRTLRVLQVPGHSQSDIALHDEERGLLIGGDLLLAHTPTKAVLTRPLSGSADGARPQPLADYVASLAAVRELELDVVLPGHGEPFDEHAALIDERRDVLARHGDAIHDLLAAGPMTAYELAHAIWENVAVAHAFVRVSDVLGHLDLLVGDGRVREHADHGETIRFEGAT